MYQLVIKYYLTPLGLYSFNAWYDEVVTALKTTDGFVSITRTQHGTIPVITLQFTSEQSLDAWAATETHDRLLKAIERYLTLPLEVEALNL